MKKYISILSLMFIVSIPVIASAGSAYIPYWRVDTEWSATEYVGTSIHISNLSSSPQTVTVTLYQASSGTKLDAQPIHVTGGITGTIPTQTSSGEIVINILPYGTVGIQVQKKSDTDINHGFGKITGTGEGALLLANAFIRDSWSVPGAAPVTHLYQRTITINGGNPF